MLINQEGKTQIDLRREHYWCKHPLINDMNNEVFGNKAEGFIGFGENNYQSPLVLKTTPRWCPIKY